MSVGSFLQLGGPMQIDGVICAITEVSCMWMGHLCSLEVLYI